MNKQLLIGLFIIGVILISGCTTKNSSSINLNECKEYFDGCNTCGVENGKIGVCTKRYCQIYEEPKCTEFV